MNASHATLSFFAVLALAGCTTMQVRTDYDAEVSFTQLSTYDWGDQEADASADPAVNSPLLERHIQDAVEGELGRMGYRKVTSDAPDLRIVYRVTAEEKSRIDGSYGYGSYGYGGPYVYPRSSLSRVLWPFALWWPIPQAVLWLSGRRIRGYGPRTRIPARNLGSGHNRRPNGRSRLSRVGQQIAAS